MAKIDPLWGRTYLYSPYKLVPPPPPGGQEPTTNSTHIWRRVRESNPGHIGGGRVLSPLCYPCSPLQPFLHLVHFCVEFLQENINGLRNYIRHSKECLIRFPNTSKLVKRIRLRLMLDETWDLRDWYWPRILFYLTRLPNLLYNSFT